MPPSTYSHKTKLANWQEDSILAQIQRQNFKLSQATGTLAVQKVSSALQQSLHVTTLSPSLQDGASIMLYSVQSSGFLSTDPREEITVARHLVEANQPSTCFNVTSSTLSPAPVLRNTFVIELIDANKPFLFGSLLRLRSTAPSASPTYLCSVAKSHLNATRHSKEALVFVSSNVSSTESLWYFATADVSRRFMAHEAQQVVADVPLLLVHKHTEQSLYTDPSYQVLNDYGVEFEVSAGTKHASQRKHGILKSIAAGSKLDSFSTRQESEANMWIIVTSQQQSVANDTSFTKEADEEKEQ